MDNGLPVCVQQAALLLGIEVLRFREMWDISFVLKERNPACLGKRYAIRIHESAQEFSSSYVG